MIAAATVGGQEADTATVGAGKRPAETETLVYPIRSGALEQLANVLREVYQDTEIRVTTEPTSNLLLIRTSPANRDEVLQLLKQLDRSPRTLFIRLFLLQAREAKLDDDERLSLSGPSDQVLSRIRDFEASGRIRVATHLELTAVENQRTMLQIGERRPVVTGSTIAAGRVLNNYRDENVGTMLSVIAKASDDGGIAMRLEFEKSEVVDTPQQADAPLQTTATLTHQTTVQLPNGQALHAGTLASPAGEAYLVMAARLRDERQGGRPLAFRAFSRSSSAAADPFTPRRGRRPSVDPRFGQTRARGTFDGRGAQSAPRGLSERYLRFSTGLVKRYDGNSDGALDAQERAAMRRDYSAADADMDGLVTAEELADWFAKQ